MLTSGNEDPLEMDLYPVITSEGVVWETFVEMEALHVFALLNGGFRDGGVETALLRRDDETGEVLTIHDDRDTID